MRLSLRFVLSAVFCLAAAASIVSARAAAPDADFYTGYSLFDGSQSVEYLTCGATPLGEGCYGGGNIGPFGRVGCMIEGVANAVSTNSVTRAIYIVDVNSGKTGNGVTLYRYLKTDTVDSQDDDRVTVILTNTVSLPLTGSAKAVCTVAGTSNFLYVGTDQNSSVVRIKKGALSIEEFGSSFQYSIKSITANQYGYVAVTYTQIGVASSDSYVVYAPSGELMEDGGGDAFLLTPYAGMSNVTTAP